MRWLDSSEYCRVTNFPYRRGLPGTVPVHVIICFHTFTGCEPFRYSLGLSFTPHTASFSRLLFPFDTHKHKTLPRTRIFWKYERVSWATSTRSSPCKYLIHLLSKLDHITPRSSVMQEVELNTKDGVHSVYNLREVSAPTMKGIPLVLFARTLRTSFPGSIVLNKLKKKNDIACVARLAQGKLSQWMPQYYPLPEKHDEVRYNKHVKLSEGFDLNEFAAANTDDTPQEGDFRYHTAQDYVEKYKSGELTPCQVATVISRVRHPTIMPIAAKAARENSIACAIAVPLNR